MAGSLQLEDTEGKLLAGPWPCRGKADGDEAAKHNNKERYPTRPFGDHPYGEYIIKNVIKGPVPESSFGPMFLLLDPIKGDALTAKILGRTGLGVHGGAPGVGKNLLRATDGCLRTTNEAMVALEQFSLEECLYICQEAK